MKNIRHLFITSFKSVDIATSACLMGNNVRYDGHLKSHGLCLELIPKYCDISVFCPEVAIGLSVPRPPVQLIKTMESSLSEKRTPILAIGVENTSLDITSDLQSFAQSFFGHYPSISGIIFKSRSPSCGLGSTPIHTLGTKSIINYGNGVVAEHLRTLNEQMPMIEESHLDEDWPWFIFCCYLYKDACTYCLDHSLNQDMTRFYRWHQSQLGIKKSPLDKFEDLPHFYQSIKYYVDYETLFFF